MTFLRMFTEEDAELLQQELWPNSSKSEVISIIREWSACLYKGKYFEMLAIIVDDTVVGNVSLYEHSQNIVSLGVEIFSHYRRQGYAVAGVFLALEKAREHGYKLVQDQVLIDNAASVALHEKIGFETDGYVFRNAKDNKVNLFEFFL